MTVEATSEHGRRVKSGQFRLDEKRARQKLRNFQLPSPQHYILEFLKAAHLLGATVFQARVERGSVQVRFDGQTPTRQELLELHSAAFGPRDDNRSRALRHLAIGVNSAHAAGLRELIIEVGGKDQVVVGVGEEAIELLDGHPEVQSGVCIRLTKRLHQAVLHRFFDKLTGDFKESELLRQRGRYSEIPVILDTNKISRGLRPADEVESVRHFNSDGEQGRVGITPNGYGLVIRLVKDGVLIEDEVRASPISPLGIRAVVQSQHVNTDLSESAVVKDEAWQALCSRVVGKAYHSLRAYLDGLSDDGLHNLRTSLRRMVVGLLADPRHRVTAPEAYDLLVDQLAGIALFHRAIPSSYEKRYSSIADATIQRDGQRIVQWSRRRFGAWFGPRTDSSPALAALWLNPDDPALELIGNEGRHRFLNHFADEVEDVTERLERLNRRDDNRRRWQERRKFVFPARRVLTADVGKIDVAVGLPRRVAGEKSDQVQVFYVKDQRLIAEEAFSTGAGSFCISIDGDLPANEAFSGPDFSSPRLQSAVDAALLLVAEQLERGRFDLKGFCALMGEFQQQLNQVFHRDWDQWPQKVRQTPLGAAPALVAEDVDGDGTAFVKLQLQRLGQLANLAIMEDRQGRKVSLWEVYRRVHEDRLARLFVRAPSSQDVPDERLRDRDTVIVVPGWARETVMEFFEPGDRTLPVVYEWHSDDADAGDSTAVHRDEQELLSRLARDERNRQDGGADEEPPEPPSEQPAAQSRSDDVDDRRLLEALLDDLREHVPSELQAHIAAIRDLEVIERCGQRPVYVVGDGNHLVFDAAHPMVSEMVDRPRDAVARAFVVAAAFRALLRYDVEHGRRHWSKPKMLLLQRRLLDSVTRGVSRLGS